MIDQNFRGRIEEVPIKRITFSEKYRIGVDLYSVRSKMCHW
jgi:serine protein kinase